MDDQKLKDYFKFDDGDLQANRSSRLSEKQKNEILKRRKDWKKSGINYSLVIIALGLGIVLINAVISFLRDPQPHLDTGALVTAGVLFLLGFLLLYLTLTGESGKVDISEDIVKKAEGPVNLVNGQRTLSGSHNRSSTVYFSELHVGVRTFAVTRDLEDIMMQGDVYAVYYDDRNYKILSLEFLSKAK
jgi:hypothetical protein